MLSPTMRQLEEQLGHTSLNAWSAQFLSNFEPVIRVERLVQLCLTTEKGCISME